jgi:hypothetical protein
MNPAEPDPARRSLLFPDPVIEFYMEKVDRGAIRKRLRMTPTERLEALSEQVAAAERGKKQSARIREEPGDAAQSGPAPKGSNTVQPFAGFRTYTPDPDPALRPMLFPDPVIEAYMKDVDRSLIREQLKKTPSERLQSLIAMADYSEELRRAGEQLRKEKSRR